MKAESNRGEVAVKSQAGAFLRKLEQEFEFAPRIAEAILAEAEASLLGEQEGLETGQVQVMVAVREAGGGRSLVETPMRSIYWTVDAGETDREVQGAHGKAELRRVRIQRLLDEALAQEGVASQEDLANALGVDVRTIKRDFAVLEGRGILLPTRGNLHGIGRGQTHKAQIIQRWLRGETYDQLALHTRHSRTCISRYIQTFVRVVELHQQGFPSQEVAYLTQCGLPLVTEYLAVYRSNDEAASRERLQEQLKRFQQRGQAGEPAKKGAR